MSQKSIKLADEFVRETKNSNEIRREARRQSALERLNSNNPRCVICGKDNPRVLELHHLAGREFSDDKVPVCRNCHRELSDLQKDHPKKLTEIPDPLEVIAHFLMGLADLLEFLIGKFREYARELKAKADDPHNHQDPPK